MIEPKDKTYLEDLAAKLLGLNRSASIHTDELRKINIDTVELSSTIAEYNQLSAEERAYTFTKDYRNVGDDSRFYICIEKN